MAGPDKKKLYPNENIKTVCYISNLGLQARTRAMAITDIRRGRRKA
jgi:hypothetical protein